MSRNASLRSGAALRLTTTAALFAALLVSSRPAHADPNGAPTDFNDMTVAQLQSAMAAGKLTSVQLTNFYINRILKPAAVRDVGPPLRHAAPCSRPAPTASASSPCPLC